MQIKYMSPLAIILKTRDRFTISLIYFSEYWHTNEIQNMSVTFQLTNRFRQPDLQECISVKPYHFCLVYLFNISVMSETIHMKMCYIIVYTPPPPTATTTNVIIVVRLQTYNNMTHFVYNFDVGL